MPLDPFLVHRIYQIHIRKRKSNKIHFVIVTFFVAVRSDCELFGERGMGVFFFGCGGLVCWIFEVWNEV